MKKALLALTILLVSCSLALFPAIQVSAQELEVSGTVTGEDGTGIPGITVQIQGTNTGTATNANGEFSITAASDAVLIFSGIGFERQEVAVNGQSTINVTMETSTSKLNELVVTALGIQRQERELGYSTKKVDAEDLTESRPEIGRASCRERVQMSEKYGNRN